MLASDSHSAGVYTTENNRSVRIKNASTSTGAIVGASNRGPVMEPILCLDNTDFKQTFGKKNPKIGFMHYCAEAFLEEAQLYAVRVSLDHKYGGVFISTDSNFSKSRLLPLGLDSPNLINFSETDIMFIHGVDPGIWNNEIRVLWYPDVNDPDSQAFYVQVYEGNTQIASETYRCTTHEKMEGDQLYIEDKINEKSKLIRVRMNTNHKSFENNPEPNLINAVGTAFLTGGEDGSPFSLEDNRYVAECLKAWDLLSDWEQVDVNILINGGLSIPSIHLKMDSICSIRQDCIAVLDIPKNKQEPLDAVTYRRETLNLNSSLSTLYTPDILIRDKDNGRDQLVPPSGHVAARYAYTDKHFEAWFAPGGLSRGKMKKAIDLNHNYVLRARNILTKNQVNTIISISGNGINIWNADTLEANKSALNDIGVRRMLCFLHASIRINSLFAVFEPNDSILRSRQRTSIEDLLDPIKKGRGLSWYEVICDSRNNPPNIISNGDLIVDVYLVPIRYAKRIHVSAIIPRTGQIEFAVDLLNNN
jgi:phage tail sheath protein FI